MSNTPYTGMTSNILNFVHVNIQNFQSFCRLFCGVTMFHTFALLDKPISECKPASLTNLITPGGNETAVSTVATPSDDNGQASPFDAENVIGLVVWILCVLYACMRTASSSQVGTATDLPFIQTSENFLKFTFHLSTIFPEQTLNEISE